MTDQLRRIEKAAEILSIALALTPGQQLELMAVVKEQKFSPESWRRAADAIHLQGLGKIWVGFYKATIAGMGNDVCSEAAARRAILGTLTRGQIDPSHTRQLMHTWVTVMEP